MSRILKNFKLWQKVNGAILLTFFFITIAYTSVALPYERHMLDEDVSNVSLLLKTLVERDQDPLANEIFERRVRAIDLRLQQMRRLKGILELNVYGPSGELLATEGGGKAAARLSAAEMASAADQVRAQQVKWLGQPVLRYSQEIRVIGERIGFIEIIYSLSRIETDRMFSIVIDIGTLLSIFLIMAVLLNFILFRTIIKPIASLSAGMQRVEAGELGQQIAVAGNDEISALSHGFNRMTVELQHMEVLKDHFLANISHELRTPLNGIIGLGESLLDGVGGQLTTIQANNLKMLVQSGLRLASLVNDILDFSKMKHHDLQLRLTTVDLRSVAELVVALLKPMVGHKPVVLLNDVSPLLPLVKADEDRLQQIMLNLVGNAIKFTAAGTVRIFAEPLELDGEGGRKRAMLRLSVSDTGTGVSEEAQSQIFKAFEQGEVREYGGTGLGLSICKQLVELHGGDIGVSSIPGQGATFSCTLPIALDDDGAARSLIRNARALPPSLVMRVYDEGMHADDAMPQPQETAGHITGTGTGETILIVDDEPVNLQVLRNQLQLKGYKPLVAQDGVQAMAVLETARPDLILLDLMMPRMTGYEVIRRIRENQDLAAIPIIVLTARNMPADLVHGLDSGANDFIAKPFRKEELLARIQSQMKVTQAMKYLADTNLLLEHKVKERTVELERLAMIDPLTGLANRRHFEARAAVELVDSHHENRPMTLLLFDIDHFKGINDNYGHAVGDVVLREIGNTLAGLARPADLVARIGGEEFVILMPGCPAHAALTVAERIRAGIETMTISIDGLKITTTTSVGISSLQAHDSGIDPVHNRADQALYRAKRSGRNRVVVG